MHHGGLAAARRSGQCDGRAFLKSLFQTEDYIVPAAEELGILFAEGQEAPVRADRLDNSLRGSFLLTRYRAVDGRNQGLDLRRVGGGALERESVVPFHKFRGELCSREQHGDDWPVPLSLELLGLLIQRYLDFVQLPALKLGTGTDQHDDCIGAQYPGLQLWHPRQSQRQQIVPVNQKTPSSQSTDEPFCVGTILMAIAQEDLVLSLGHIALVLSRAPSSLVKNVRLGRHGARGIVELSRPESESRAGGIHR